MVEDDENIEKYPCDICGRNFKPEALEKHSKICKKVFASKRKAFDSKKHRIINDDHEEILRRQEKDKKKGNSVVQQQQNKDKKQKWKKESEEIRAVCKNKNGDIPIPSTITDSYIHCTYCNKKYNENSFYRHLDFCMKKAKENQMKPKMNTSMKPNFNVKFGKK